MSYSVKQLALKANALRQELITMLAAAGSGHTAGPLGLADLMSVLYFSVLKQRPKEPLWPGRDRLIFSAGHTVPIRYVAMAEAGYFPKKDLLTLRQLGSPLQGHPARVLFPAMETSTGPLGQGISVAVGLALAGQMDRAKYRVYVVSSDGEMNEGQTWEAMLFAAKYRLHNLTVFLDRNNIQIDGTSDDVMPLAPVADKWQAFGWNVISIDGHNIQAIIDAIGLAQVFHDKPTVIILNTTPGKGASFMENNYEWHGKPPTAQEAARALVELRAEQYQLKSQN